MAIIHHSASPSFFTSSPAAAGTGCLSKGFFEPLLTGVRDLPAYRNCDECPDEDWLQTGVWRCLAEQKSGRGFLQANVLLMPDLPGTGPYFDSLRSERRLAFVWQASDALYDRLARDSKLADPFAQHPELGGFEIYAGEGHYHQAAAHDPRVLSAKDLLPKPPTAGGRRMSRKREDPPGTKYAVGHFFALNLRNALMRHLVVADQEERKKEHDMRALKGLSIGQLRMGAPKGRKVLYAWDRASIDFLQWHRWKQSGVYFISLEKSNMTLDEVAGPHPCSGRARTNAIAVWWPMNYAARAPGPWCGGCDG